MRCLPILLAVTLAQVSTPPAEPTSPRTLTIRYSDGRTTPRVATTPGRMWTPTFPRSGSTERDGLQLSALQIAHRIDKDAVVVDVSLIYGMPHQRTVPVATVRVKSDQPVEVDQLAEFGVDPITLTISDAVPAALAQPSVTSVSSWIDVNVDLPAPDVPVYTITMTNRAPRAVSALSFRLYREGKAVGSGRRKGKLGLPVMGPDGQHEFTFQAPSATGSHGFDRLEVVAVLWADGTVEGDPDLKTSEAALAIGNAEQLRRVIAVLREHPSATIAEVRARVEALPIDKPSSKGNGQVQVKQAVLEDLSEFARAQSARPDGPAGAWIQDAVVRYSAWLARTGQ
jgi:hypothetical protein